MTGEGPAVPPSEDEAREFARAYLAFLRWVHDAGEPGTSEIVRLVRDHLGETGLVESVVARELPPFEHVNVQVALDV